MILYAAMMTRTKLSYYCDLAQLIPKGLHLQYLNSTFLLFL